MAKEKYVTLFICLAVLKTVKFVLIFCTCVCTTFLVRFRQISIEIVGALSSLSRNSFVQKLNLDILYYYPVSYKFNVAPCRCRCVPHSHFIKQIKSNTELYSSAIKTKIFLLKFYFDRTVKNPNNCLQI